MGKTTQQTSQSSSPPPQVLQNYQDLINRATTVASTPYQQYQGQIVPDLNMTQINGLAGLSTAGGTATPYIDQAAQYTQSGAAPITLDPSQYGSLISPYAQSGAQGAVSAGQGLAQYGTQAGQALAQYGTQAGQGLAQYGTQQGAGIAQYGTQAGQGISGLAQQIGAQGPQLQQFSAQNIQQYQNPYTQQVIDATMANINRQNGIQQNDLVSRGVLGGNAFGGDRAGVAAAELGRNQDMASSQVIANLLSSGYGQALGQFNTNNQQALAGQQTALQGMGQGAQIGLGAQQAGAQLGLSGQQAGAQIGTGAQQAGAQLGLSGQQAGGQLGLAGAQLGAQGTQSAQQMSLAQQQALAQQQLAAGSQYAGLGSQALSSQLTAAQAQLGAGTVQQQQQAAELQVPYQQFLQQQAYPFQTTQFLGQQVLGTGAASGGTSQTTSPGPSMLSQGLGAGLSAAAMYALLKDGGAVHYAAGGGVGVPSNAPGLFQPIDFASRGVRGYVPDPGQMTAGGMGPPKPPSAAAAPSSEPNSALLAQAFKGLGQSGGGGMTGFGASSSMGDPTGLGGLYASGGLVPEFGAGMRFADGGMPDDPFGDDNRQAGYDLLRQGLGVAAPDSIPGGESPPAGLEPFRLAGPEAMNAWRGGVDADVAKGLTAPDPTDTAMAQNTPTPMPRPAGADMPPALPPQITGPAQDDTAMAYAQPPAGLAAAPPMQLQQPNQQMAQAQGLNGPARMQPSVAQALLAAGLGMMSSRSPNALGGIGEGGAAGLANYAAQQKAIDEMDAHPVIDHSGPTTRIYYPSTKQWIDTGIPTMSAAQKAANDLQKSESARTQGNSDRSYKLQERAQDRLEAKDDLPTGYRKNKDTGALEAIPGGPADPTKIKADADAKRGTAGLLDDDTIKDMAGQYLEGDKSVMQNLGRGAQGAENIVKLRAEIGRQAREVGMTPAQVATKMADFAGRTAAMRTLGTRGANVEYAANTANKAIDLAEEAYNKLPRSQFVPFNKLREMYDNKTSSAEQAAAFAATNTLVNEYARVASGGSSTATEGMREHAREMLNTAQGPDAFKAVLGMMRREIQTAKSAYNETRKEFLAGHPEEKPGAAAPAAGAPAAAAPNAPTATGPNGQKLILRNGKWEPLQ